MPRGKSRQDLVGAVGKVLRLRDEHRCTEVLLECELKNFLIHLAINLQIIAQLLAKNFNPTLENLQTPSHSGLSF